MPESTDPQIESAKPRASYNTIGGINGPLVVLDGVRTPETTRHGKESDALIRYAMV